MFKDANVNWSEDWFCEDYTLLQENIFEMVEDFKKLSQNPKKPATLNDIREFFCIKKEPFELFKNFAEHHRILSFSTEGHPVFDSDRVIYLTQNGECIFESIDMELFGYNDYQESFNHNRQINK
jgi:hypothetical protein